MGPRIVNIAHPQPVTLDSVLRAYRTHLLPNLTWLNSPAPNGTIPSVTLSTDKLQGFVKFEEYNDPANAMAAQMVGVIS